jgi:uracil-DNA glycosylase
MNTLSEEVRSCTHCTSLRLPFVASDDTGRAFHFPPVIGATGTAPLLFVGINPRISDSNREFHRALMRDSSMFVELARNVYQGRAYIGPRSSERHYSAHLRIARRIYPDQPFEAIAAVTELFFCASTSSSGLPLEHSPCADKYFERVLAIVQPQILLAIGRPIQRYLMGRFGSSHGNTFATWGDANRALVLGIPHPNSRGERICYWERAAECARSYLLTNASSQPPTQQHLTLSFN